MPRAAGTTRPPPRMRRARCATRSTATAEATASGRLRRLLHAEDLPQIGQVARVVAHGLAGRVAELGDRLAVATDHLHHDAERRWPQVVGEDRKSTRLNSSHVKI